MGTGARSALGTDQVCGGGQRLAPRLIGVQQGPGLTIETPHADLDLFPKVRVIDHPDHLEAQDLTPPDAVLHNRFDPDPPTEVVEAVGWRRNVGRRHRVRGFDVSEAPAIDEEDLGGRPQDGGPPCGHAGYYSTNKYWKNTGLYNANDSENYRRGNN